MHRSHEDERELRVTLAKALKNAVWGWAKKGELEQVEKLLQELRELHRSHEDERELRVTLAWALGRAVPGCVKKSEIEHVEKLIEELRELYSRHEGRELKVELVTALYTAILGWMVRNEPEGAKRGLKELWLEITGMYPVTWDIVQDDAEKIMTAFYVLLMGVLEEHGEKHELVAWLLRGALTLCRNDVMRLRICSEVKKKLKELLMIGKLSRDAYLSIVDVCD